MNLLIDCISEPVRRILISFGYLCVLALVSGFSWGCSSPSDGETPVVFAAASLSDVLTEIADEYTAASGNEIALSFAGSSLLANQVVTGAPASAIVAAGFTPIKILIDAGKVDEKRVKRLLENTLVVVSGRWTANREIESPSDLIGSGRVAVPNAETAPAGEYANAALAAAGVWEDLDAQIVPTLHARAALGAVATGNTEWAIVYRTDAMSNDDVSIAHVFVASSPNAIPSYYVAPLEGNDSAVPFIEFLLTKSAGEIFERNGFNLVSTETRLLTAQDRVSGFN